MVEGRIGLFFLFFMFLKFMIIGFFFLQSWVGSIGEENKQTNKEKTAFFFIFYFLESLVGGWDWVRRLSDDSLHFFLSFFLSVFRDAASFGVGSELEFAAANIRAEESAFRGG